MAPSLLSSSQTLTMATILSRCRPSPILFLRQTYSHLPSRTACGMWCLSQTQDMHMAQYQVFIVLARVFSLISSPIYMEICRLRRMWTLGRMYMLAWLTRCRKISRRQPRPWLLYSQLITLEPLLVSYSISNTAVTESMLHRYLSLMRRHCVCTCWGSFLSACLSCWLMSRYSYMASPCCCRSQRLLMQGIVLRTQSFMQDSFSMGMNTEQAEQWVSSTWGSQNSRLDLCSLGGFSRMSLTRLITPCALRSWAGRSGSGAGYTARPQLAWQRCLRSRCCQVVRARPDCVGGLRWSISIILIQYSLEALQPGNGGTRPSSRVYLPFLLQVTLWNRECSIGIGDRGNGRAPGGIQPEQIDQLIIIQMDGTDMMVFNSFNMTK